MQELRLVGVSEDGANLLLADGDGGRHTLEITDELRATIRRDRREPASADGQAKVENPLRPRDVQGLIRGGVPLEEIAERAGWTLEKVQRYEGPIRAERDYVSELAQRVQLFGRGETTTLRERADRRLAERGVEAERVVWDSWKNDDTHWTVIVRFPAGGRQREATWLFDPVNRALRTVDDEARWLGGDEIPAADDDGTDRDAAAGRPGGRVHRDVSVFDVEAEGGLEDAQDAHLGARVGAPDPRSGGGDLTASMRARQASRGRTRSASAVAAPGGRAPRTSQAAQLPRQMARVEPVEPIDVGTTPPPVPSHPRPEELRDDEAPAGSTSTEGTDASTPGATSSIRPVQAQPDVRENETDDAPETATPEVASPEATDGSRRRKSRRPRVRVEPTPVRTALVAEDDEDQDESLFGELPGFHDGGPDDESPQHENDASVEGSADDDTSTADDEADAAPTTKKATDTQDVPSRASQSRKSSRPSVPSWDDIMFGGRGPKR